MVFQPLTKTDEKRLATALSKSRKKHKGDIIAQARDLDRFMSNLKRSRTKTRKVNTLRRRKRTSRTSRTRKVSTRSYSAPFRPKRRRSSGRSMMGGVGKYVSAGAYGAVRARLSDMMMPLSARIPLGGIADEAGMFIGLWGAKKLLGRKVPFVADVAKAGMLIEAARMGEAFATGQAGIGTMSNNGGGAVIIGGN